MCLMPLPMPVEFLAPYATPAIFSKVFNLQTVSSIAAVFRGKVFYLCKLCLYCVFVIPENRKRHGF